MIDGLIANAGRLRILTTLAGSGGAEFVALRQATQLTDGNLATHARRLQSAGLISIDKQFRDAKPVTRFTLTPHGRAALESHVRALMHAISAPANVTTGPAEPPLAVSHGGADEEWVD